MGLDTMVYSHRQPYSEFLEFSMLGEFSLELRFFSFGTEFI